jgi:hypothetical protein
MIHYHGLPITPATAAVRAVSGGHAFVSFRHADQLSAAKVVSFGFLTNRRINEQTITAPHKA